MEKEKIVLQMDSCRARNARVLRTLRDLRAASSLAGLLQHARPGGSPAVPLELGKAQDGTHTAPLTMVMVVMVMMVEMVMMMVMMVMMMMLVVAVATHHDGGDGDGRGW